MFVLNIRITYQDKIILGTLNMNNFQMLFLSVQKNIDIWITETKFDSTFTSSRFLISGF